MVLSGVEDKLGYSVYKEMCGCPHFVCSLLIFVVFEKRILTCEEIIKTCMRE